MYYLIPSYTINIYFIRINSFFLPCHFLNTKSGIQFENDIKLYKENELKHLGKCDVSSG